MKSSNMAHHQDHAFSSWFLIFAASHKPVMSEQPTKIAHVEQINRLENLLYRVVMALDLDIIVDFKSKSCIVLWVETSKKKVCLHVYT